MKKPSRLQNRVRELRFFAGEMTQGALAEKVGVTRQTIAAIEKNKYAPSLETAFLIAEAFAVPITDVFSYPPEGEGE
ncbi:helix-turn-helix transcriptional regulator [Parvularcula maris]|uniref:helix-turn-helix transcriptional regulator n=1 Tax=Parvularcula maris TaxID=2965077 RepID=UPI00351AA7C8